MGTGWSLISRPPFKKNVHEEYTSFEITVINNNIIVVYNWNNKWYIDQYDTNMKIWSNMKSFDRDWRGARIGPCDVAHIDIIKNNHLWTSGRTFDIITLEPIKDIKPLNSVIGKSYPRRAYVAASKVYLKSSKTVLILEGDGDQLILSYSIETDLITNFGTISLLSQLNDGMKMPANIKEYGVVLSLNENYILIFGGKDINNDNIYCDDIYILDLQLKKWFKSKIKTPIKSGFIAANINMTETKNDVLVYGYIRCIWNGQLFIAIDIQHIIALYFGGINYIHLINKLNRSSKLNEEPKHWGICLSKLIEKAMPIDSIELIDRDNLSKNAFHHNYKSYL